MVHQHIFGLRCITTPCYIYRGWIGLDGPVDWLPSSPDLNPLDFFFWCHLKSLVYETPVITVVNLKARIDVASADIANTPGLFERVRQSIVCRCGLCYDLRQGTADLYTIRSTVNFFKLAVPPVA
ncbi:uncharacterized protein TNCV_465911 [Trichonephila clavipes]|nr:uncharacterized protein TNCV_465911 [Trichonephila clavipes]